MNKTLSLILLNSLGNIPFIEKKSGVVQVLEKSIQTSSGPVIKKFPFSTLATVKEIQQADTKLVDMTPDSSFKGILYFEDNGINLGRKSASTQEFISELRLVVWLNKTAGISRSSAMLDIISRVTKGSVSSGEIFGAWTKVKSIPPVSSEIFGEYDYDEAKSQYLLPPFEYFALDLSVTFRTSKNCILTP